MARGLHTNDESFVCGVLHRGNDITDARGGNHDIRMLHDRKVETGALRLEAGVTGNEHCAGGGLPQIIGRNNHGSV